MNLGEELDMATKMFHYTSCGLRNVWLKNGFEEKKTAYGKAIAIHNVEGLHRAIGLHLVTNKPRLSGAEIRFLRKELDLSQGALANMLGVGETTMRGWEKNRPKITKPAERLLRMMYREHVDGDGTIRKLVERIAQINRDAYQKNLELEETQTGWKAAA